MTVEKRITFADVLRAHEAIRRHLPQTPAWNYPLLDRELGCQVVVKHENTQPTGAFKVRGGVALVTELPEVELRRGLVTASTGNHAQSIAFGAQLVQTRAVIVMPEGAAEEKVAAVGELGAEVILAGQSMYDAMKVAQQLATDHGFRFIDPGNTVQIIAGHATVYLELFRQYPDLEAVFVPIGSGSGAAGAAIVRDQLAPNCRIIGVQSAEAPAAYESWRTGELQTIRSKTRHGGLATGSGYQVPQGIMATGLHDFLLVSDKEIDEAAQILARKAHTLAEGAGVAALAGLRRGSDRAKRCAVICTGGNASADELARLSGGSESVGSVPESRRSFAGVFAGIS